MKVFRVSFTLIIAAFFATGISACNDKNVVTDTNQEIAGRRWSYIDKIKVPVTITDVSQPYNVYLNLRHSGDYKYANMFVLVHQLSPGNKRITERKEIKLAYPDGEWLGKGSGSLYSYQILIKSKFRFAAKGTYFFEIEQNMRDNPLREVTDVGLRVEKASLQ